MTTRPIHPVYVPTFPPPLGNVELSTFAYLTVPRPPSSSASDKGNEKEGGGHHRHRRQRPNLVTACGSTVRVYELVDVDVDVDVDATSTSSPGSGSESEAAKTTGKDGEKQTTSTTTTLILIATCNLAGNVVSLHTLPGPSSSSSSSSTTSSENVFDELLLGFAGHPRLSVCHLTLHGDSHHDDSESSSPGCGHLLRASSAVDLSAAAAEGGLGAVAPLQEDDLVGAVNVDGMGFGFGGGSGNGDGDGAGGKMCAAVVLGGGVGVAAFELRRSTSTFEDGDDDDDDDDDYDVGDEGAEGGGSGYRDGDGDDGGGSEGGRSRSRSESGAGEGGGDADAPAMDVDSGPPAADADTDTSPRRLGGRGRGRDGGPRGRGRGGGRLCCHASEPFVLNLRALSQSLAASGGGAGSAASAEATKQQQQQRGFGSKYDKRGRHGQAGGGAASAAGTGLNDRSIATGFGEILDVAFLRGYTSPTIVLLHGHRTWPGRMAGGSVQHRPGAHLRVTALSLTVRQRRAVVLWSTGAVPADSRTLTPVPDPLGGCLVTSPNGLTYVNNRGRVCAALAANGFAHASCPNELLLRADADDVTAEGIDADADADGGVGAMTTKKKKTATTKSVHHSGGMQRVVTGNGHLRPNPSPLPRLSVRLDGSRLAFVGPTVAALVVRGGRAYALELHAPPGAGSASSSSSSPSPYERMQLSLSPTGYGVEGSPSTLAVLPFDPSSFLETLRGSGGEKLGDGAVGGHGEGIKAGESGPAKMPSPAGSSGGDAAGGPVADAPSFGGRDPPAPPPPPPPSSMSAIDRLLSDLGGGNGGADDDAAPPPVVSSSPDIPEDEEEPVAATVESMGETTPKERPAGGDAPATTDGLVVGRNSQRPPDAPSAILGGTRGAAAARRPPGFGVGILFAGSRMGDSTLLAYGWKESSLLSSRHPLPAALAGDGMDLVSTVGGGRPEEEESSRRPATGMSTGGDDDDDDYDDDGGIPPHKRRRPHVREEAPDSSGVEGANRDVNEDDVVSSIQHPPPPPQSVMVVSEDELEREDEELYAGYAANAEEATSSETRITDQMEHLVPDAAAGSDLVDGLGGGNNKALRQRKSIPSLSTFAFTALDSLPGLGPTGYGCEGPTLTIAGPPPPSSLLMDLIRSNETAMVSAAASAAPLSSPKASSSSPSPINDHGQKIVPCGFGASGGLAVLGTVGHGLSAMADVVAECDVMNVVAAFSPRRSGVLLLARRGSLGPLILREDDGAAAGGGEEDAAGASTMTNVLREVDLDEWCGGRRGDPMSIDGGDAKDGRRGGGIFGDAGSVLRMPLLAAGEITSPTNAKEDLRDVFLFVTVRHENMYALVGLSEDDNVLESRIHHIFPGSRGNLRSASVQRWGADGEHQGHPNYRGTLSFAFVWEDGSGSVLTVHSHDGNNETPPDEKGADKLIIGRDERFLLTEETIESRVTKGHGDRSDLGSDSDEIVAIDMFLHSSGYFGRDNLDESANADDQPQRVPSGNFGSFKARPSTRDEIFNADRVSDYSMDDIDAEDLELYGPMAIDREATNNAVVSSDDEEADERGGHRGVSPPSRATATTDGARVTKHIAVCRTSGLIQIFVSGNFDMPVWEATGGGLGKASLSPYRSARGPMNQSYQHSVMEMRVFFCGPSNQRTGGLCDKMRPLCLLLRTGADDLHLYTAKERQGELGIQFSRVSLAGIVTRKHSEEGRHRAKLSRKGVLSKAEFLEESGEKEGFRHNVLLPFSNVSGQSGLFSAGSRPLWFVAERGFPAVLCHRMRHFAAGSPRPVKAFCSGFNNDGFVTVHERIGRVGSQRLTRFWGTETLSNHTLLPGGGISVRRIPLGVTVRRVSFIDDVTSSSLAHSLYVLLVSRELESDQSHLNDDGLSFEERESAKAEKEAEKTRRQVEADLGGFDVEQEWVEEIEREDYFEVDQHLGGAPPIPKEAHEVWLVDASNGWKVLDRFELQEYEHATSLLVAPLTEVLDEAVSNSKSRVGDEVPATNVFIAVGTGYLDQDGEDIGSKGRLILFEMKKNNFSQQGGADKDADRAFSASLSLTYEKDILLGPVMSLSCLECENKSRLVVGAGAEVTVEQWGSGKLVQVGFFHANMQVQDIKLFKTFFLLSDAYDSLHFLVWRESDKSLTLLAKDYEPTAVYAAGLLSRGSSLAFACHDDRQNIQFFQYAPKDAEARGGNKLVCRADFHLGTQTIALQSHWCRSSLISGSATLNSSLAALRQQDSSMRRDEDQRFGLHFGTSDGGLGVFLPVSEQVYWRLTALQSVMSNALDSDCALSHRAWRLYRRTPRRGGCKSNDRKKGVLDGALLRRYLDLSVVQQEELASAIGSTVDLIVDNLLDLEIAGTVA